VAHSLSVVIPAHNAQGWISKSLNALQIALQKSEFSCKEVIVVDDGSTDSTFDEASKFDGLPVIVIQQPNCGRFLARKTGVRIAKGDFVLFLDTRVFLDPDSLKFVHPFLSDTNKSVWTSDVRPSLVGNRIAHFWYAIEGIFWRRYMANPMTTSFGLEDFDFYPKGTTALFAPRLMVLEAIEKYSPSVSDWSKVNDDTALLRTIAKSTRINISPSYGSTYHARTSFWQFLKHARHRGNVLIDGYLHRGTRLYLPIVLVLLFAPMLPICALFLSSTILLIAISLPMIAMVIAIISRVKLSSALVLGTLFWPFAGAYLIGMYEGLGLRVRKK
jgi:glycosyltransferase involved in cell wall biosynthesis